jgi:putative FmdB family regulatory protein
MPIYEYICEKCGSHIEVMQKVSDAPLKRCQKCRGKLEKIVSRTSFQLKGSGWYMTDYSRKASQPANEKADKTAEKKSETPASTTASSKTD